MKKKISLVLFSLLLIFLLTPYSANAAVKTIDTDIKQRVYAVGQYSNWDGVSTVAQFTDENGELGFAVLPNSIHTLLYVGVYGLNCSVSGVRGEQENRYYN